MAQAPLQLATPPAAPDAERQFLGANVRRLMARFDMTLAGVVAATRLDERTVRSLIRGRARPHARTIHKLAAGLGVEADELLVDPAVAAAAFDRATNPAVAALIDRRPEVFTDWTPAEFDELYSRVAVGGQLTADGALAAAEAMNRRRELLAQVALVLETDQGELLAEYVSLLYRRATAPFAPQQPAAEAAG